jgi:ketosteroid isomerase-like protein
MSQENVEVVRELAEAWVRDDYEAWLAAWDAAAEFYPLRSQLEGHPYRGREGLRKFMTELDDDWDYARFEVDEIRDAGEQVVALAHFTARGPASRVELHYPIGIILTVRQGLVVYARFYSDASEALEAVGRSDQAH